MFHIRAESLLLNSDTIRMTIIQAVHHIQLLLIAGPGKVGPACTLRYGTALLNMTRQHSNYVGHSLLAVVYVTHYMTFRELAYGARSDKQTYVTTKKNGGNCKRVGGF
jgi:hypothetical protein